MSTTVDVAADQPTITMSRIYDAPRERIWEAITKPEHVRLWWGGAGVTNPVCEMDLRPGGRWTHVMRLPDGHEISMKFVFVEITPPERLVWEHAEPGKHGEGPPSCRFTVTLEALGGRTRWHLVAQFGSRSERDASVAMGFSGRITASNDRFDAYLKTMEEQL
jgi:uncharacterized protein YndB with AHSA1/START domain